MFRSKTRDRSGGRAEAYLDHGWDALEDDDPEAAEAEAREALKLVPASGEALEVLGAALVDQERYDEALEPLAAALKAFPADPSISLDLAVALLGVYRLREAARRFRALITADETNAEAHYWLGVATEFLGDEAGARNSYERATALDAECFAAPVRIARDEFEGLIAAAIKELPAELRRHLDGEVTISVTDAPGRSLCQSEDPPLSPLILGLFVGSALSERSVFDSASLPPMIMIFQRNIERVARTREECIEELRVTLLHELGHYLGLDEDDLAERGLE